MDRRQFLVAAAAGIAGCAAPTAPDRTRTETEILVENLEIPWDLAFAPTGELFLTERTGRILRFAQGTVQPVATPESAIDAEALPPGSDEGGWWLEGGEGGVLGIAVHPSYPDPSFVYVYYTRQGADGKTNRVSRFDVEAPDPAATERPVVDGIPAGSVHNGGRIAVGPDDYLWITTGDSNEAALAQDGTSLAGKVLRVDLEGGGAPGNPGGDLDTRVYTLGHRNPQGLSWLPDGTPIVTEHGPTGHDEVNLLEAGANYGWPEARTREEYAGTDFHRPLVNTPGDAESWAPAGGTVYTGDQLPAWQGRFVFGTLFGQRIQVLTLSETADLSAPPDRRYDDEWLDDTYDVGVERAFEDELGRVRHVEQGPDGYLYAITSNRDARAQGRFPRSIDDVLVRLRQETGGSDRQ